MPWLVKCRGTVDQSVQRILLWERRLEQAPNDSTQNSKKGNEGLEKALLDEEKWRETVQGCCTKTATTTRNIWRKMKLPFLSENYCEEYVEVHGLDLRGRKECCSEMLVKCAHVVAHGVVEDSKAMNTNVDPERQVELAQSWMSVGQDFM